MGYSGFAWDQKNRDLSSACVNYIYCDLCMIFNKLEKL